MKDKTLSYEDALTELNGIHESIEKGDVSIDQLEEKVKRAGELVKYCKTKLRSTEEDLSKLFEPSAE